MIWSDSAVDKEASSAPMSLISVHGRPLYLKVKLFFHWVLNIWNAYVIRNSGEQFHLDPKWW